MTNPQTAPLPKPIPIQLTPDWSGETVVCIGGGPSLNQDDIDHVQRSGCRVIAINDAYRVASWADILYACDLKWWRWHQGVEGFKGQRITSSEHAALEFDVDYLPGTAGLGLSDDHSLIHYGSNSGFQALNIAYLKGAARVLLLGYDMRIHPNGASHWFGDHPDKIRSTYDNWFQYFNEAAEQNKVDIINVTPGSALPSFPMADLREVL